MQHDLKDITILGAGPTGLFALFYAGMRGVSAQIIDALSEPGGQLTALYPEKYIFDVAGFPRVLAKDLVAAQLEQARQFGAPTHFDQRVVSLEEDGGTFTLFTETDRFPTKAIVIAAGISALSPRRLPQPFAAAWYGKGIHDRVLDPEHFRDKQVLIIGGGDSAFDWAHQLLDRASSVTLAHRSDRFRAHAATVEEIKAACAEGRARMLTFHELHDITGNGDSLSGVVLKDIKAKTTVALDCDVILPMLGFVSDLGTIGEWGLNLENHEIVVNTAMETGRTGIWGASAS